MYFFDITFFIRLWAFGPGSSDIVVYQELFFSSFNGWNASAKDIVAANQWSDAKLLDKFVLSLTVLHDQRSISDFEEAAKESAVIILRCGNISHIFTEIVGFVCKSYLTVLGYLFLSTLWFFSFICYAVYTRMQKFVRFKRVLCIIHGTL